MNYDKLIVILPLTLATMLFLAARAAIRSREEGLVGWRGAASVAIVLGFQWLYIAYVAIDPPSQVTGAEIIAFAIPLLLGIPGLLMVSVITLYRLLGSFVRTGDNSDNIPK